MNDLLAGGYEGRRQQHCAGIHRHGRWFCCTPMPYIQLEISKAEVEPGLVGFCGPLRRLDCSGPSSPPLPEGKDAGHQCGRHTEYCRYLQNIGLQTSLPVHQLCILWFWRSFLATGLQSPECIRTVQAGWGAVHCLTLDKHFIVRIAWNAPRLGIVWPEVTGQYC